jgi:cyclase
MRVIEIRVGLMDHLRTLRPLPEVFGFYDGRVDGYRFSEGPNWVDEGALSLGICSYAVVDDGEALIYDTHVSVEHARYVRRALEREGVRRFTVLLSHWHLDHVAGTAAFADCEILAGRETAELLTRHRQAIEEGTHRGPPAIDPLVLPTRVLSGRGAFAVGRLELELIPVNIHSRDAIVVWLPERRVLLAGDTLEDTVTFVAEPEQLREHGADLQRLAELRPERILPNHGDPDVIAAGGYGEGLIRATRQYIDVLMRLPREPELRDRGLRELMAEPLQAGWITYFAPYEAVHRHNLQRVFDAG